MKLARPITIALSISIFCIFIRIANAGEPQTASRPLVIENEYLIRQTPGATVDQTIQAIEKQSGIKIKLIERLASDNLLHIRILRDATKGNPEELAASVNKDTYSLTGVPSISSAEPVVEFRLTDTISDLSLTQSQIQNVMSRIEWTPVAMPRNASRGKPVVVAVIDTGVFLQHELFSGLLLPGVDVTNNTPIAAAKKLSDGSYEYHGTTTAGIIALMIRGGKINGPAIANVKILPIRATSSVPGDQRISSPALIKAIDYAMRHGANIINASFGDVVNSQDVKDKIAAAGSANVLLVAAAGNGQRTSLLTPFQGYNIDVTPFYPASYRLPNIVSVAALSVDDSLAQFSNWGPKSVLIAAPGESVLGPVPLITGNAAALSSGYSAQSGTSVSTPFVAGAAAVFLSTHPNENDQSLKVLLASSAKHSNALETYVGSGGGLAVQALMSAPGAGASRPSSTDTNQAVANSKLVVTKELTVPVSGQTLNLKAPTLRGLDAGGKKLHTTNPVEFLVKMNPGKELVTIENSRLGGISKVQSVQKVDTNLYSVHIDAPFGAKRAEGLLKQAPGVKTVEPVTTYQLQ